MKTLDIYSNKAYFILHLNSIRIDNDKRRYQNKITQRVRFFEPSSRARKGTFVSEQPILRPKGLSTSQIRNASPCVNRWSTQIRNSSAFWRISPYILRNRVCLYSEGAGWITSSTTRSKRSAQNRYPSHGFHRNLYQQKSADKGKKAGRVDTGPIQYFGSPSKHRTCHPTQKKIQGRGQLSELPVHATELYELLRNQVLKGAVRPEGLSVVLYHGLLRGLQILSEKADSSHVNTDKCEPFINPVQPDSELVHLLANMVVHTQQEVRYVY